MGDSETSSHRDGAMAAEKGGKKKRPRGMAFERFVSRRFLTRRGRDGGFAGPLSGIAVVAVALGVTVMLMAVSILRGFQHDIADKVSGFGSHITVQSYATGLDYDGEYPVAIDSNLIATLEATEGVRHVQCYATKGGMVKTADQIYGVMLRGLSQGYDTTFYASCLTQGTLPKGDNEVLISTTIASRLRLEVGDKMRTYFWQGDSYRARAFEVAGTYNTDLTDVDEHFVLGTLHAVQRLNGWTDSLAGGYELLVDRLDDLDEVAMRVLAQLPYDMGMHTVVDANPALFSWLDLLDSNIVLILAIMSLVCVVAIVSALLIIIFEKKMTIGLLRALGANDRSVRRIFLIKGLEIVAKGVAIGNAVALLLSAVQKKWQLVRLDPESYSMSHVPVEMNLTTYIVVSIGVLLVCMAALLLPAAYVSRLAPSQTLRTEN